MKHSFDSFFSSNIHLILPIIIVFCSTPIIFYIKSKKGISSLIVILSGTTIVLLSAMSFFYIASMIDFASFVSKSNNLEVSENIKDKFMLNSKIIVFMFPVVFTALGINIISDAITNSIDYKKQS